MSTTYKTISGDTFESISRKSYGTEDNATLIQFANPGTSKEPFVAGIVLTLPDVPGTPQNIPQDAQAENENEVAILVEGKRFRFWDSIALTRNLDSIDTVGFGAPFRADLPNFRETFRPFSYKSIEITVGGVTLFTGTMIGIDPLLESNRKRISISGYSTPGVLNDCTPPSSAFPLEFEGVGLKVIASTLAAPFGLTVTFEADEGAPFSAGAVHEPVAIDPGDRILPYLAGLAKQRKLIISNTPDGALLFLKAVETGRPVANLIQGLSPLLSVLPLFAPQDYYSSITGIPPVVAGLRGTSFTVQNKLLEGVVRPHTFPVTDTFEADVKDAVDAKLSRMYGNMVSYNVRVDTWRDKNGELWKPNTTINLHAPDAMIYDPYEFLIRSVGFTKNARAETATLNLVLAGAFSDKVPEVVPWGK